ncbi:unnamed protein product [Caenorhabditis bovis]|uniref:Acyl_transf_3 domain-containing protein n=1 Tax=Caenorhabditis bovis TaxID=2654633 RepID=A0A8S1E137_9PELO|nr:unnamed protein product [Caenorhabditis bovis]
MLSTHQEDDEAMRHHQFLGLLVMPTFCQCFFITYIRSNSFRQAYQEQLNILTLVLFHISPQIFTNGYLGVDIFFVLSGFLMAKCLSKHKITPKSVLYFYYKRVKRIAPLYYLTCFLIIVAIQFFLCDFWWKANYRYSIASLFFVTNQLIIHDSGNYFDEFLVDGSSLNAFIHFWSLGVEMQFYLLVPFIFLGLQLLKSNILKLAACICMTIFGCAAFLLINEQFAFNFMFLRLWQFSAGFVAHFLSEIESYSFLKPSDATNAILPFLLLLFLPSPLNSKFYRPFITLLTTYLLYLEDKEHQIFNSKILNYIGNISYTVYLIHWPIITIFGGASISANLQCLVLIAVISILIHHLFEKKYLKMEMKSILILISTLIVMNFFLQSSIRNHDFWKTNYTDEEQELIDKNTAMLPYSWLATEHREPCVYLNTFEDSEEAVFNRFGHCVFPNGNGSLRIMVIGNSYAMNFVESIRKHFNYNYSTFSYVGLYVYILGPFPYESQNVLNGFLQYAIKKPDDVELLNLDKKVGDRRLKYARKRLSEMKCRNCEIIDLAPLLVKNEKYRVFDADKMLSYLDNTVHFTQAALDVFEPVFRNISQIVMDNY